MASITACSRADAPTRTTSVAELLARSGLRRAEARLLLAAFLGVPVETLVAYPEQRVDDGTAASFAAAADRRARGEPVAYLLGEKEFFGHRFAVSPAVLVPRPETELLVEMALRRLQSRPASRVLDLGTGSGCFAISVALHCPAATVVAVDRSAGALEVAGSNARRLGARVEFIAGDWYEDIRSRFDLVIANPPYVAAADPHLHELRYEPMHALVAGADGLDDLRRIVAGAPAQLNSGGALLVEHGHDQAASVRELFTRAGFDGIETHRDLAGIERVCAGTMPENPV